MDYGEAGPRATDVCVYILFLDHLTEQTHAHSRTHRHADPHTYTHTNARARATCSHMLSKPGEIGGIRTDSYAKQEFARASRTFRCPQCGASHSKLLKRNALGDISEQARFFASSEGEGRSRMPATAELSTGAHLNLVRTNSGAVLWVTLVLVILLQLFLAR